jgi:co-chaperonin GroES (HSP10)
MKVNITPVKGKLLIKLETLKGETKSGIKLVNSKETWENETILAEIVSKHEDNRDVEVGDVIVICGHAGKWIDPELMQDYDYTYRIIEESEVIAIANQEN